MQNKLGTLHYYDYARCKYMPNTNELINIVLDVIKDAGMTVVDKVVGNFPREEWGDNHGDSILTLIVPLKESHFAIHTWPEKNVISVDLYTCGDSEKAFIALMKLSHLLKPGDIKGGFIPRGVF